MFRIFTDNAANLPVELIERWELGIVPITCSREGQALDPFAPFDGKSFYDEMRGGTIMSTSMPSIGTFLDAFTPVLERGEDILYIGMSGGISGTSSLAQSVAAELEEEYPWRRVAVIDTRGASLGEGLPVLYAAALRERGLDLETVRCQTEENCEHMWQVFTVDDLRYLRKTGRLYSAAVKVTNLLNVKPILMGDPEGHIVLRHMNVGRRRALDTVAGRYREKCTDMSLPVGLAHADSEEDAQYVIGKLRAAGCTGEITTVMYEPVTGSHVGPGTVALFFYGPERALAEKAVSIPPIDKTAIKNAVGRVCPDSAAIIADL